MRLQTFDAHCHLLEPSLIEQCRNQGILKFFMGGVDPQDWQKQLDLAQGLPQGTIHPVFGYHPWFVAGDVVSQIQTLRLAIAQASTPVVAIGETGLDFHPKFPKETHALQMAFFEAQLRLAHELNLPVVLHIVRAHKEALATLKSLPYPLEGIVHSFLGDAKAAHAYLRLGLTLSFQARLGSKMDNKMAELLKDLPLESIVLESDAPDQSPTSTAIFEAAQTLAQIKALSVEDVLERNCTNLSRIFGSLQ